jgi:hypothetical protein
LLPESRIYPPLLYPTPDLVYLSLSLSLCCSHQADESLSIYTAAAAELCRQVTVECSTRGGLLTKVLLGMNVVFLWAMKSMSGLCGALEARLHALCHAVEMVEEQNERWASLTEILRVELHLVSRNGGPGPSTGRSGGGNGAGGKVSYGHHHRHHDYHGHYRSGAWYPGDFHAPLGPDAGLLTTSPSGLRPGFTRPGAGFQRSLSIRHGTGVAATATAAGFRFGDTSGNAYQHGHHAGYDEPHGPLRLHGGGHSSHAQDAFSYHPDHGGPHGGHPGLYGGGGVPRSGTNLVRDAVATARDAAQRAPIPFGDDGEEDDSPFNVALTRSKSSMVRAGFHPSMRGNRGSLSVHAPAMVPKVRCCQQTTSFPLFSSQPVSPHLFSSPHPFPLTSLHLF